MSKNEDSLVLLFERLHENAHKDIGLDQFVLYGIKILDQIYDDQKILKEISEQLMFVCKFSEKESAVSEIKNNINDIENDLEENLRGFSNLLDSILQDYSLKKDYCEKLESLQGKYKKSGEPFYSLVQTLYVLSDIEDAFEIGAKNVSALIFLNYLTKVLSKIKNIPEKNGLTLLRLWLDSWPVNDTLRKMFAKIELSFCIQNVSKLIEKNYPHTKTFLLIYLCSRTIVNQPLTSEEAKLLDNCLQNQGFLPLKVFVESGFFFYEKLTIPSSQSLGKDDNLLRVV